MVMRMQQIRRSLLWVVLGAVVGIVVYRVAFHIPEPVFDQERLRQSQEHVLK